MIPALSEISVVCAKAVALEAAAAESPGQYRLKAACPDGRGRRPFGGLAEAVTRNFTRHHA